MKTSLVILLIQAITLWTAVADDELKKAEEAYNEAYQAQIEARSSYLNRKREAQKEYRDNLAEMVLKADKIELFLLDFSMAEVKDADAKIFPIAPFQGGSRVLAEKTVLPADLAPFKAAIAEVLSAKEDQATVFCHYPIHGIRVYRVGALIFESSLCWTCVNYSLEYPDGPGIETMSQGYGKLKKLFNTVLPIPPEEQARFKSAMEKMNSKDGRKSDGKK